MKRICYILAATFAVVACNKTEIASTKVVGDDILFDAASYINSTKADPEPEPPASPALGTGVHFGVSANLNYDSGSYIYFQNQEVACTDGVWAGVNSLKWPKGPDGYSLDFLAYAPYSGTPWCKVEGGNLKSDGTDGQIEVATIDPTDDNYDLLYSDWTRGKTKESGSSVPMLFHHALAAVNVGLNIVRSNDAVILDANGRYTYEEWAPTDPQWSTTHESYIVPIGSHPNDVKGIVLPRGTVLSGPVVVFDPDDDDDTKTITLPSGTTLDQDYIQYQKFGYRLKNSIQNIWIASLIECRLENIATSGSLVMAPNGDGWTLPTNSVWTMPSTGEAGLAAHSGELVFFEGKDIEIPPHMRSTVHIFPMELHIIPQDLHWSPLTPTNNQKLHIKMHVRQFNYKNQRANDAADVNGSGVHTGDASTFDYRDIYKYETNDDGSFKGYVPQDAELAPGVSYKSMVWRDGLTPSYEYDVEKEILLFDNNNFVSAPPQYWKMNTRTIYITRINFADHLIEFAPSVQPFAENEVEGGGV